MKNDEVDGTTLTCLVSTRAMIEGGERENGTLADTQSNFFFIGLPSPHFFRGIWILTNTNKSRSLTYLLTLSLTHWIILEDIFDVKLGNHSDHCSKPVCGQDGWGAEIGFWNTVLETVHFTDDCPTGLFYRVYSQKQSMYGESKKDRLYRTIFVKKKKKAF